MRRTVIKSRYSQRGEEGRLNPRKDRVIRILKASGAMFVIAFGIYMQIKMDIGLSPWQSLNQGLSRTFPITYGQAQIASGVVIIAIDLLLKEKIGVGTLLDAFLIGMATDIYNAIDPIPAVDSYWLKIPLFVVGLAIVCFGQFLYMRNGLSCGPRDSLMVALGRKFPKISIGYINNAIFVIVLAVSWLLGATIGIGTVIAVFGNGRIMDFIFKLVRFEPRNVQHEHIGETARALVTGKE